MLYAFPSIKDFVKFLHEKYGFEKDEVNHIIRGIIKVYIYNGSIKSDELFLPQYVINVLRDFSIAWFDDRVYINQSIVPLIKRFLQEYYSSNYEAVSDVLRDLGIYRFAYAIFFIFNEYGNGFSFKTYRLYEESPAIRDKLKDFERLAKVTHSVFERRRDYVKIGFPKDFILWLINFEKLSDKGRVVSYFAMLKILADYCEAERHKLSELLDKLKERGITWAEFVDFIREINYKWQKRSKRKVTTNIVKEKVPFTCYVNSSDIERYAEELMVKKNPIEVLVLPKSVLMKPTVDINNIKKKIGKTLSLFQSDVFGILMYVDKSTFEFLDYIAKDLGIRIIIYNIKKSIKEMMDNVSRSRPFFEIIQLGQTKGEEIRSYFHERWLSDGEIYIDFNTDLKVDAMRNKEFTVKILRAYTMKEMINRFNDFWEKDEEELTKELGTGTKIKKRILYRKTYA